MTNEGFIFRPSRLKGVELKNLAKNSRNFAKIRMWCLTAAAVPTVHFSGTKKRRSERCPSKASASAIARIDMPGDDPSRC